MKLKTKKKAQPALTLPYIVVGVDPGKAGGVAWITPSRVVTATPMPEGEEELNDLVSSLEEVCEDEISKTQNPHLEIFVFIEQVGVMPGQGISSAFTFGTGFGQLRQAFSIFPREFIRPQVWQKGLQIPPTDKKGGETKNQFKDRLRIKARQLFPNLDCWGWGKGKQLAVADAILLMEYGRRKLLNGVINEKV